MTTCDNDHEPISFDSPFAALCPLCALKREMAKEIDEALASAADDLATEELARLNAQTERDELRRQLNGVEDERDYLESKVKELQAKLEGK